MGDTAGLITLRGGTFRMGTDDADGFPGDREGPVREVTVAPFAIDACAVTNARFAEFVDATGHRTEAEEFGWTYVFAKFVPGPLRKTSPRPDQTPWWCGVAGAYWRAPEGPHSTVEDRWDHPVVHVSWNDALAYCAWAGRRLPTEIEWEYAARGGLDQARFPWGDDLTPGGEHRCNIWQGRFPVHNTEEDGHLGTAPADAFQPNGFGLYNVAGNVWEWCADWFDLVDPSSPTSTNRPTSPADPANRAMRGGSYLCHESYCNRYRVAARTGNTPDSSSGNTGFRTAADV
ncbi:formylglycine-generating enzyme family protein [Amycolatopsis rhabdoformis]|uniref:Formylglycine-generating enzyme family protein n=1 Tax=Amycolatopsis rhabdoformis TaxID=1448059 RepID=A0ABZ1HVK3_9PSEU|nr:formylglycine-generating enzyme family protein [Amycolatopsis rhabdoformis]WSE26324.1 formylglycine-generating enzyme family protein [Amycolatopsis rhabdoformis]